jgi:hypothetical protein
MSECRDNHRPTCACFAEAATHKKRCAFRICRATQLNEQGEDGHSGGACCPCTCGSES